jgi:glycosyltransferase involved in cell wall biosynthesis
MDRLRLAVALPHLGVFGGIRRFLELGRVWTERGHDVTIATPGASRREETWLPFPGRRSTIDDLARERWDAVLSPDPALFRDLHPEGALRVFYAVLEKAPGAEEAWRSADLVLANSAGMARHLERRGVHAVPAVGGVNLGVFHPPDHDPRPARARDGGPIHALVYGRLSRKRKGTLAAARAVSMAARRTGAPVELMLFDAPSPGEPPAPERLPLSIPHRWALHPSQDELAALYGDADIFVSAERRAGWCNTAAEAMACGAAVVCTRSGTEDFARHEETALVSRFPWAWALAGQVARLLRDSSLRAAIAQRGCDRIRGFTWERTADAIENALSERLGRQRPAAEPLGSRR